MPTIKNLDTDIVLKDGKIRVNPKSLIVELLESIGQDGGGWPAMKEQITLSETIAASNGEIDLPLEQATMICGLLLKSGLAPIVKLALRKVLDPSPATE